MSKYTVVELEFNDTDCIKEALTELGYPFEEHEIAQNLVGYQNDQRSQKAHIIIRRKHVGAASNDVGFLRKEDGTYDLIISEYDRGSHRNEWLQKLKQIYGVSKIKKKAKAMGYVVRSQKTATDGKIKVKVFRA